MIFDTLRVYEAGRFYEIDLPDWYRQAERLSEIERLDWHLALERVLDCDAMILTPDIAFAGSIEILCWRSPACGTLVLIESPLALIEQILIPNATDWVPFLTKYVSPLISAAANSAAAEMQHRIGNAFIAWARHGEGTHIDRDNGVSRIDRDQDQRRRKASMSRIVPTYNDHGSQP